MSADVRTSLKIAISKLHADGLIGWDAFELLWNVLERSNDF